MYFFDVLVHRASIGEDSVAEHARELLPVVQRLSVSFQVRLPPERLATFRTRMDLLLKKKLNSL